MGSKELNHEFDSSQTCNYCGVAYSQLNTESDVCPELTRRTMESKSLVDGMGVSWDISVTKTMLAKFLRDEAMTITTNIGNGNTIGNSIPVSVAIAAMLTRLARRIES